jgi:hypothetical protein
LGYYNLVYSPLAPDIFCRAKRTFADYILYIPGLKMERGPRLAQGLILAE